MGAPPTDLQLVRYAMDHPLPYREIVAKGGASFFELNDPLCKYLWEKVFPYWDKKKQRLPDYEELKDIIKNTAYVRSDNKADYLQTLKELRNVKRINYEGLFRYAMAQYKANVWEDMHKAETNLEFDAVEESERRLQMLKLLADPENFIHTKTGADYEEWVFPFSDERLQLAWETRMDMFKQCVSTGVEELDFMLNGGLRRGALTCYLAPPKSAKSLTGVALANGILRSNETDRVVVFLFDNKRKEAESKYHANASGVSMGYTPGMTKEIFDSRLRANVKKSWGDRLVIRRLPRKKHSVADCKKLLIKLKRKLYEIDKANGVPLDRCGHIDCVIFDYADQMVNGNRKGGSTADNKRHDCDEVFADLARLGEEGVTGEEKDAEEFAVVTMTQASKGGKMVALMNEDFASEAYAKTHHVDLWINVNFNSQDRAMKQCRYYVSMGRRDWLDYIVHLNINTATQRLEFNYKMGVTDINGNTFEAWATARPEASGRIDRSDITPMFDESDSKKQKKAAIRRAKEAKHSGGTTVYDLSA